MQLLSPAGNFEKLKAAITFGADAVYFSGKAFGLRAKAGNFSMEEIAEAMVYLHSRGKKGYLTVNAYARDAELETLATYLADVATLGVDAFIISDPGVFQLAKKHAPLVERHISTQANTTNSAAIAMWAELGATRVVLARELAKAELATICERSAIEIECFIHGAVCISYSGRCLMSAYMAGRDANRGECTQPCRWNYRPPSDRSYVIQEASRPLQEMEMVEEANGTYLYNAKDLCLLDRVGELIAMGVSSAKIEGRMKSVMYVAVTTGVYRQAIDRALRNPQAYEVEPRWKALLSSVSNRNYTEGFYSSVPDKDAMNYATSAYVRTADFLGVFNEDGSVSCRGKFVTGEKLQVLTPMLEEFDITAQELLLKGETVKNSRANDILTLLAVDGATIQYPEGSILRRML